MEPLFLISRVMTYGTYVIVAVALWHIIKGRNKRIIYVLGAGFSIVIAHCMIAEVMLLLINSESVDTEKLLPLAEWMAVVRWIGIVIFAWGFLLLAKEYRVGQEKIQPVGAGKPDNPPVKL